MNESEKGKIQELAQMIGFTVAGIIWALAGNDADLAQKRANEILSTTYDAQVARRKVEEIQSKEGR